MSARGDRELHAVTGASGYSGGRIARRLPGEGHRLPTLTGTTDGWRRLLRAPCWRPRRPRASELDGHYR